MRRKFNVGDEVKIKNGYYKDKIGVIIELTHFSCYPRRVVYKVKIRNGRYVDVDYCLSNELDGYVNFKKLLSTLW